MGIQNFSKELSAFIVRVHNIVFHSLNVNTYFSGNEKSLSLA
jgi:hypothetical protein